MSIVANAYNLLVAQGVSEQNLKAVLFTHVSDSWYCCYCLIQFNQIPKLWYRNKDNESVSESIFDTRSTFGASSIFTRRSCLQSELYRFATETSRPGNPARILTGVNIKSIDPSAGVVVADTGETYVGDLIIGADGINSAVRGAVLAKSSGTGSVIRISEGTDVPTGIAAYITAVPAKLIASDPALAFQAADGVGGICSWKLPEDTIRVLCYPRDNKEYFQILVFVPETPWTDEFEKNNTSIIKGIPAERVLKDLEAFHPAVKKLLKCTNCE